MISGPRGFRVLGREMCKTARVLQRSVSWRRSPRMRILLQQVYNDEGKFTNTHMKN